MKKRLWNGSTCNTKNANLALEGNNGTISIQSLMKIFYIEIMFLLRDVH